MMKTGLCEEKVNIDVPVQLKYLNDLKNGIKVQLNQRLMKYDEQFKGVVLGYWNIKLLENAMSMEALNNDSITIKVQATVLSFKFTNNSKIVGKIVKSQADHISVNVLNDINVTIRKENISDAYTFDSISGVWKTKNSEEVLFLGDGSFVCFVVDKIKCEKNIFFLEGVLGAEGTGPTSSPVPYVEEKSTENVEKRKRKDSSRKKDKKIKI